MYHTKLKELQKIFFLESNPGKIFSTYLFRNLSTGLYKNLFNGSSHKNGKHKQSSSRIYNPGEFIGFLCCGIQTQACLKTCTMARRSAVEKC
jgi:hypothetical protein